MDLFVPADPETDVGVLGRVQGYDPSCICHGKHRKVAMYVYPRDIQDKEQEDEQCRYHEEIIQKPHQKYRIHLKMRYPRDKHVIIQTPEERSKKDGYAGCCHEFKALPVMLGECCEGYEDDDAHHHREHVCIGRKNCLFSYHMFKNIHNSFRFLICHT